LLGKFVERWKREQIRRSVTQKDGEMLESAQRGDDRQLAGTAPGVRGWWRL